MALKQMSAFCECFIRETRGKAYDSALNSLSLLDNSELFGALAVLDRVDLQDLASRALTRCDNFTPFVTYAIRTVQLGARQPRPKLNDHQLSTKMAALELAAIDHIRNVVQLKQTPLAFSSDQTLILPVEVSKPPRLGDQDYADAAQSLGVEVEAIKAVSQVESGRDGYEDGRRPTIRYELHVFNKATQSQYLHTHPWLAQLKWTDGKEYHNNGQAGEYSMLYNAMALGSGQSHVGDAIGSASWGRFQVMGYYYSDVGWSSAASFARDMFISEANHLKAFVGYIKSHNLQKALQNHDWSAFAKGYNGIGQVARYAGLLKAAYDSFIAAGQKAKAHAK